jgi:glycine hydroxymethyltransferase
VYQALLEPGDTVLGLSLDHGGHLTHGSPVNASGLLYHFVSYGVTAGDERIDMDQVRDLALEHRPKMIVAGATAYPRRIDPEPFRAIADEVGALFMFDAAHIAGLIAGGAHPNPVPYADVVTFTTHKTLRGPRGGCILTRPSTPPPSTRRCSPGAGRPARARDRRQGGGLPRGRHPSFREYAHQIVTNASALAEALAGRASGSCRAAPTTTSCSSTCALRRRAHRQAGPGGRSTRPASRSTRTPCPTTRAARSSPAACASARRRSPRRA